MTIIRTPRNDGDLYYPLRKSIREDRRISWEALGLLVYLLGKPDNWQVSIAHLVSEKDGCEFPSGRDKVYRLLNELQKAGYIVRSASRDEKGRATGVDYHVHECPAPSDPLPAQPDADETTLRIKEVKEGLNTKKTPPPLSPSPILSDGEGEVGPSRCAPPASPENPACNKQHLLEQRFTEFWQTYPKKTAKPAALRAFKKVNPSADTFSRMLNAIALGKASAAWKKDNGQYIPNPATWLNNRRWEDEQQSTGAGHLAGVT